MSVKANGVVLRYCLKDHVVDDTGNLLLVLWDKHCIRILGKNAEELFKNSEKEGELPFEIEELMERKMMFEIEVSKFHDSLYEDSFSVSQGSTDIAFIDKHSNNTPSTQELVYKPKTKRAEIEVIEIVEHLQDKVETSMHRDLVF